MISAILLNIRHASRWRRVLTAIRLAQKGEAGKRWGRALCIRLSAARSAFLHAVYRAAARGRRAEIRRFWSISPSRLFSLTLLANCLREACSRLARVMGDFELVRRFADDGLKRYNLGIIIFSAYLRSWSTAIGFYALRGRQAHEGLFDDKQQGPAGL
jgi:hypothetical protein